jgi:hypothetical protein
MSVCKQKSFSIRVGRLIIFLGGVFVYWNLKEVNSFRVISQIGILWPCIMWRRKPIIGSQGGYIFYSKIVNPLDKAE